MFKNLLEFQKNFSTEIKCIRYLEKLRWNNKPVCPLCKNTDKSYKFAKAGLYACGHCKREFTIRKGTIFEDSALSLVKWFNAFYFEISGAKSISSCQLAKNIGVRQATAWFMLQRIRLALKKNTIEKMTGDVEIDETYLEGKEGNKHSSERREGLQSGKNKMVVVGCFRKKKTLAIKYINKTNIKNIKPILDKYIELEEAKLFTDESPVYKGYERETVNHSEREFVRGNATTNDIEGTFGLFKRRIYGTHRQITKAHIDKYINSFVFYFNNKSLEIAERFENTMQSMFSNNNLTYAMLTGKELDLRRYTRKV